MDLDPTVAIEALAQLLEAAGLTQLVASARALLEHADPERVAIVIASLAAAGIVKGATGIGYSSCALPLLASTIGLRSAISLVVVPAMASNLLLVCTAGHLRSTLVRFWPLYLATLPGIVAGIALLASTNPRLATQVLGVIIVLYGIQVTLSPNLTLPPHAARLLKVPVGLLNGFLTGLTGSQVMPLMPYMLALRMEQGEFVQANNLAVIIASTCLGAGLLWSGLSNAGMLVMSIAAVLPALIGVQIGTVARAHIRDRHFRRIVIVVLMVIGATLVAR